VLKKHRDEKWCYCSILMINIKYMKNTCLRTVAMAICSLFFLTNLSYLHAQQIAFPGAEGIGAYTTGGRGMASEPTTVYEVTDLTDNVTAPTVGSFRYAVTNNSPAATYRTVVFRVSGTIRLAGPLSLNRANTTIAGQTAPGDGICIADYPVSISANNLIVRHLRIRLGDRYQQARLGNDDAFSGTGRKNIIIDHCTMSWSDDETFTVYGGDSTTLQWNIMSEPLDRSYHDEGTGIQNHGYGGIWGGRKASFHHNLVAHVRGRAPRFDGSRNLSPNTPGQENADFRNNVIYNWADYNVNGGEGGNYNIINNYYKYGPSTPNTSTAGVNRRNMIINPYRQTSSPVLPYGKYYLEGNFVDNSATVTANNWLGAAMNGGSLADTVQSKVTAPFDIAPLNTQSAVDAYNAVLAGAGATLPKRDTLDERIVNDVRNRTGRLIDVQGGYAAGTPFSTSQTAWPTLNSLPAPADTDHDGMPDSWETANASNPNDASDRSIIAPNGYTLLENYLNSITSQTLPSKLLSFQAVLEGKQVKINWGTTNEVNTDRFEIEKSSDGSNFSLAGTVPAKNTVVYNSYLFIDKEVKEGTAYYRLKMIDKDGQYIYSSVVKANGKKPFALNISPNPAFDIIKVQHAPAGAGSEIKILSTEGKSLLSVPVAAGKTSTVLNLKSLAKGVYLLQYSNGADKVISQFIKQ
jgi:hypothetical protein